MDPLTAASRLVDLVVRSVDQGWGATLRLAFILVVLTILWFVVFVAFPLTGQGVREFIRRRLDRK